MFNHTPAAPVTRSKNRRQFMPVLLALALCAALASVSQSQIVYNAANGHSYQFVKLRGYISWHEARTMAENGGGYLATVTDSIEADIVAGLLAYPGDEAWLGATDEAQEGIWTWVTGEPWWYTNWYPGEPNAAYPDEDYLLTQHILGGKWVDAGTPQSGLIIEREDYSDSLLNLKRWPSSQGGNDHWYAVIPQWTSWDLADSLAGLIEWNGLAGHLATVTSPDENQFILQQILPGAMPDTLIYLSSEFWLGGISVGPWEWVTDEPFVYTNWADGHPSDIDTVKALAMVGFGWDVNPPFPGQWVSRAPHCGFGGLSCRMAVIEFEPTTPDMLINVQQWPVSEGGNDHWYALLAGPTAWHEAASAAETFSQDGVPGHLATVTSHEENEFILTHLLPGVWTDTLYDPPFFGGYHYWLGGHQAYPQTWEWITGEPFSYTNWAFEHPLDSFPDFVLAMSSGPGAIPESPAPGEWVSVDPYCYYECLNCCLSVIEWDTEPPHPPRVLRVPEEYPTIMSAIMEAHHGAVVLVAPGVYHEAINFLGKNITVRAAEGPLVTTITSNRTANLVMFNHGENASAVLDGFTLRGGWMAIYCINSGPTIRHNICVGQNVWNWAAIGLSGPPIFINDPSGDPRYSATFGPAPAIIENNTIVHSANGGISTFSTVPPTIRNNIVAFNAHYGIHQQSQYDQPQPIIGYNDVFGNDVSPGGTAHGDYINIPDPGPGAISVDPLFGGQFTLLRESPCIDAGHPHPRYNDPNGSRNDMGALPYQYGPIVIPTNEWIVVYCSGTINDVPPLPGNMILAYDPDGVVCGAAPIHWDGSFGFMPIYRDDPYSSLDEGAEPGDLILFTINGREVQSAPEVYWTQHGDVFEVCEFLTERCLSIPLHTGWNLISWNVAFEGEIYDALEPIMGCLDVVHSFEEGALTFDPWLDMFNTLTHVDYHHGYWVRMHCDAVLEICGQDISPWEWITLEPGWNLVSYWPPEPLPVEHGFVFILGGLDEAMGFDHGAQIWLPNMQPFNTLEQLRPLYGYWAKVGHWLQLSYPGFYPPDCTSCDGFTRHRGSNSSSPELVENSRTWMSVYGDDITVDGIRLAENDIIEFFSTEEALCGRGMYTDDRLRFVPVYGHDESGEHSKLYPKEDDEIAILLNGRPVYPNLRWEGNGSRVRLSRLTTDSRGLPQTMALKQNYPNPFNPGTHIAFEVPVDCHVDLTVYNVLGQRVRTLTERNYVVGRYEIGWDGRDENGQAVSTGVYFYRLTAGDAVQTKKMLLLR